MTPNQILSFISMAGAVSGEHNDMTLPMLKVLCVVAAHPEGIIVSEIHEQVGQKYPTTANYIQLLSTGTHRRVGGERIHKEGLGLVDMEVASKDYRKKIVSLSAKGEEFFAALKKI